MDYERFKEGFQDALKAELSFLLFERLFHISP